MALEIYRCTTSSRSRTHGITATTSLNVHPSLSVISLIISNSSVSVKVKIIAVVVSRATHIFHDVIVSRSFVSNQLWLEPFGNYIFIF